MNTQFKKGDRVAHPEYGLGNFICYRDESTPPTALVGFEEGIRVQAVWVRDLSLTIREPNWAEVRPGDTPEFEVQGDTLSIKAQGEEGQATVLGWKTTELDGVWNLLSIKKRNPPVPVHLGATVEFCDRRWMLVYSAMVISDHAVVGNMVWLEINENTFNWVGHMDIDRENFEVIFEGWKAL